MKKRAVRAITGLLCAAMVFSHMADMRVYAMEGGTGQEAQMQESVSGNNDAGGETEGAEQPKDTGEQGDPAVSEDMEESGDQEYNEEAGAEGTEEKAPDSEDPDKEKNPEGPPEGETEKEGDENEAGEDEPAVTEEPAGEKEPAEETEAEETAEEGMMLFSALAEETAAAQDADSTYTDANGVIYHYYGYDDGTAEIYELEDCQESTWDYKALNIPSRIGDYTVTRLTFSLPSETPTFPSVTIPETVTYMKDSLFKRMKISELYYNAEAAETGAGGESTGVFFQAYIWGLHIGGNVKSIPDYCFASSYMTLDELTLDVERIGRKAFYDDKTITTLTIGEDVKEIGREALAGNEIENIHYNAVNAVSEPYGEVVLGTFGNITVSGITIGSRVTAIPEHLFYGIDYTADTLVFPDCLTTVGAWAFHSDDISIGELTVGEHVESIGKLAFSVNRIGTLNYNAVDAQIEGMTEAYKHRTPFYGVTVGTLQIGEQVQSLPDCLFYAMGLIQDTLILPDSVTYVGDYVLSRSGDYHTGETTMIGTLVIGENVAHIGKAAFGFNTYKKAVVRTVQADVPPRSDVDMELPICTEIEIHRGSPYYDYFAKSTQEGHITLLCEDFETTRGEEYYDAQKKAFVTPVTDACTVCGYGETSEEYSEAHTVIFKDYDGRELSRQHLHKGEDATAPEEPERTGWRFTGWDKEFTGVTSDLTVKAVYQIREYAVVFKDYDGTVLSELSLPYGADIYDAKPADPERESDEDHTYQFDGWTPALTEGTTVTGDAEYTATYADTERKYSIRFLDYDGTVISDLNLPYGTDIHAAKPADPEREADESNTYTFSGWEPELTEGTMVTGDAEYTATYADTERKYSIRFLDYNGSVISDLDLPYGTDIHAARPADPEREADESNTYTFSGWEPELTEGTTVTGDAEYTASYTSVEREYSIRFLDYDGSVISNLKLPYGTDIYTEKPADPKRAPDERHTYQFDGWKPALIEGATVTGDAEYTASYTSAERLYRLSFVDHTGSTIKTVMEPYGTKIADKAPKNPTREPEGAYTYTFAGWQPALSETDILTRDMEYQAVFTSSAAKCRVVFQNYDGSVLKEISVAAGETIGDRAPAAARAGEGHSTYTFAGWQPALDENAPILGDITYKALYTRKTQTGVLAENELNHPAGEGISAADVRLYPVYEIYDTSNHFQERLTDREHPVDAADIRLSKDRIEKGSNRISAEQISTGFQTEFSIFGSYIDGITAEPASREIKTGSRLQELDVYFTRNRMGEDGQVKSGIVDRTGKVRRYTFAGGASYVIIRQGDNAIRITEKETGENHSCTIHVTGVGKEQESNPPKEEDEPDKDAGEQEQPSPPKKDIWKIALDIPQKKEADTGRSISLPLGDAGETERTFGSGDPFTLILKQADKPEKAGSLQEPVRSREPIGSKEPVAEKEEPQETEAEDGNLQAESESPEKPDDGQTENIRNGSPLWIIPAVLILMGIFALLVMLLKGRRKTFHGILTTEENPSVKVDAPDGMDETVQEVIDRSETLAECLEELKGSGATTYLPAAVRMEISYRDADGQERTIKGKADEDRLFGTLSRIADCDTADVCLYHDRYGIDIRLKVKLRKKE